MDIGIDILNLTYNEAIQIIGKGGVPKQLFSRVFDVDPTIKELSSGMFLPRISLEIILSCKVSFSSFLLLILYEACCLRLIKSP